LKNEKIFAIIDHVKKRIQEKFS
jgi:hypothetical protein